MDRIPSSLPGFGMIALVLFGVPGVISAASEAASKDHRAAADSVAPAASPTGLSPVMLRLYRRAEGGEVAACRVLARQYAAGTGVAKNPEAAFAWYLKAAMRGDSASQCEVGEAYLKGVGVKADTAEAMRWYRFASAAGEARAMLALGLSYEEGADGVAKNIVEATRWYRLGAGLGDPVSHYRLGRLIASRQVPAASTDEPLCFLTFAAEQGVAGAASALAVFLDAGRGTGRNAALAAKWYRVAAEQGDNAARYRYGLMLANGDGVTRDESRALEWVQMAGEGGDKLARRDFGVLAAACPPSARDGKAVAWLAATAYKGEDIAAQYALGVLVRDGRGVKRNPKEAVALFQKPAKAGDGRARYALACLYESGDTDVPADWNLFRHWMDLAVAQGYRPAVRHTEYSALRVREEAAKHGDAEARYELARRYESGDDFLSANAEEALRWYVAAGEQGHVRAARTAATWLATGRGGARDMNAAVRLFRRAANGGDVPSCFALASFYDVGDGVPRDEAEASRYLLRAAESGDAQARSAYSVRCWNGKGVPPDRITAYAWMLLSLEGGLSPKEPPASDMIPRLSVPEVARAKEKMAELRRRFPPAPVLR